MGWDDVEKRWNEVAISFRERFGQITGNDIQHLTGDKDRLVVTLQEAYGHSRDDAEKYVEDWRESLGPDGKVPTSTSGASTY